MKSLGKWAVVLASVAALGGCTVSSGEDEPEEGAGGASGGEQSGELLLLAYNVAGLPEPLSSSEPATNTQYIGPLLNDYDLVLVQESWLTPEDNPFADSGLRAYHEILVAAAEHPYQSESADQPFGEDPSRPTALLSDGLNRFSNSEFGPLTRVAWDGCFGDATVGAADCLAFKGFSVAEHTLADGVVVEVYNLHAEAGSTEEDQALQVADFQQLGDYIVANSAGKAIILAGDTNLHTDREEDRVIWDEFLAKTGLTDVCAMVDCGAEADMIDKAALRNSDTITIEATSREYATEKFVRPTDGAALSDHPPNVVGIAWTSGG